MTADSGDEMLCFCPVSGQQEKIAERSRDSFQSHNNWWKNVSDEDPSVFDEQLNLSNRDIRLTGEEGKLFFSII